MEGWHLNKIKIGIPPFGAEFGRVNNKPDQTQPVIIVVIGDLVGSGNAQSAAPPDRQRPQLTAAELDMETREGLELLRAYMTLLNSPGFSAGNVTEALRYLHETFGSKDT